MGVVRLARVPSAVAVAWSRTRTSLPESGALLVGVAAAAASAVSAASVVVLVAVVGAVAVGVLGVCVLGVCGPCGPVVVAVVAVVRSVGAVRCAHKLALAEVRGQGFAAAVGAAQRCGGWVPHGTPRPHSVLSLVLGLG